MKENKYLTAPLPTNKMPTGISYILTNEAGERFAFYGTRCILVIFMTKYLLAADGTKATMTDAQSKAWFHFFVFGVYFTSVIGALLADIWLNKYKTIIWFSMLCTVGYGVLAIDNTRIALAVGLTLIAFAAGFIKPCLSANVGDQFGQSNKHLLDRTYHYFYFAINIGAVVSMMLTPELLARFDEHGPHIAFGVPAAMMAVATIVFWLGRHKFVHIPAAGLKSVAGVLKSEGIKVLARLSVVYIFIAAFWALFDQMDSAWILQATQMNRDWLGRQWEPAQTAAVNPAMILILIPAFTYVIYPAINRVFHLTALGKISIGLFIAAATFVFSACLEIFISAGYHPSIGWLVLAHLLMAAAEIMISITCLEFSYTQAPKELKSLVMAVFFLSIALGNAFTAIVNAVIQNEDGTSKLEGPAYFWFFAGVMLVTATAFVFVARNYRGKTYIQDETTT